MSTGPGRSSGAANWAGNVAFRATGLRTPTSLDELAGLVAGSTRLRALGTGHSFSPVADTTGELVSLAALPQEIELDAARGTVSVPAAMRYGELASRLHRRGHALHNLGSLPHISVAGACATATHGSGSTNGNLATAVSGVELVTADGAVRTLERVRDGDRFAGAVVALGCLGVVTRLTLDVEPSFRVRQLVYEHLPRAAIDESIEDILAAAYSVSIFTDWRTPGAGQVWLKQRLDAGHPAAPARWMGARLAEAPRHPLAGMPAENCTAQLGVPGPWHERLPHFRLDFTPSAGDELQSEYLLPDTATREAWSRLDRLAPRIAPVLQVSEIRTVAPDDLWLSPSFGRETVAFHFTWVNDAPAVAPVLREVEAALLPLGARPHWGKVFAAPAETVRAQYERLADFRELRRTLDPGGVFANDFVDCYL